jgi:hypothetical protein
MLNNSNLVIITTTLSHNSISEKRRINLINNFSKYNISVIFNHGTKDFNHGTKDIATVNNILFIKIKNNMEMYKKTTFDYAIICDDDFYPISNFLEELNKTVALLPDNWECLHLCPGYAWGRLFRDTSKISYLNPESNMNGIDYHESGRFYINCNPFIYVKKGFWMGGPVAILLNKNSVDKCMNSFINQYNKVNHAHDVVFTRILNENSYVCRQPQLGYEKEEGGTTFR